MCNCGKKGHKNDDEPKSCKENEISCGEKCCKEGELCKHGRCIPIVDSN